MRIPKGHMIWNFLKKMKSSIKKFKAYVIVMQDGKKPTQAPIILAIIWVFSTSNLNPNLWRPENYISRITPY